MFTLKNAFLVVALASQFALCGLVIAQQVAPPLPAADFAAGEAAKVSAMFKGKENPDAALIKKFVQREVARFVNVTEKSDQGGFATIRTQLINNIRSSASEPTKKIAIDHLLTLTKSIAVSSGFHMAARINCVAALSELELQSNSPLPEAFVPLVNIARDEAQPLPIRAIALYGLNRHAKTRLAPANAEGLAKVMAVLVASKPKSSLDVKAHAWVVRRGFDVLTSLTASHGVAPALARLLDDKELPSVRLAAAEYLPRVDQSKLKMTDEQKTQYFVGLAQLLEQQLVMWYEREEDTLNMKSGASGMGMGGGMGGMGMGGMEGGGDMGGYGGGMDGGMGGGGMAGMGGSEGGYGGMAGGNMGGYGGGMGEGGMSGPTGPKPRPLDTQPWEVRMTRRSVNQLLQIVHTALDGKPNKTGRPVSAVGKGLVDLELPADVSNPASDLLKAVESLQNRINDSTKITTMNSLLTQTKKLIERVMDQVREVPALTAQYPKYQEKKEDLGEVLDQPKANTPAGDGANPNGPKKEGAGDPPADAPVPGTPADAGKAEGN